MASAENIDPIKIMWLIGGVAVLGIWLSSGAAINPIAGNSTITGSQAACGFSTPTQSVPSGCTGLSRAVRSIFFLFVLGFPLLLLGLVYGLAHGKEGTEYSDSLGMGDDDEDLSFRERLNRASRRRRGSSVFSRKSRYNPATGIMDEEE